MTIFQIENALLAGDAVTILMRHAERPPLDPGDTTFGATLPITARGRETARRFGMLLSHIVTPQRVRAYASSTVRTIQTAECILDGLRDDPNDVVAPVTLDSVLGSSSPFFGGLDERMALIAEGHYRDRLNDYFRTGEQRGYRPLAAATDEMEEALCKMHAPESGLVVAVTHDINVAAFMAGRGVITSFDEETWPHYLDAVVLIRRPNGGVEYGLMRHDSSFDGIDL